MGANMVVVTEVFGETFRKVASLRLAIERCAVLSRSAAYATAHPREVVNDVFAKNEVIF